MLRSLKSLEKFSIDATDGTLGKVTDFYFDDQGWAIRYLVVDTSVWLRNRKVLISPYSIMQPDWNATSLPVTITKDQVRNSPDIEHDEPISRQYEKNYLGYFGYPYYWGGLGLWGGGYEPRAPLTDARNVYSDAYQGDQRAPVDEDADPHLRSCNAVKGYAIIASDGEIGHVNGFLLDDRTWSIRYLIVSTSNWWGGHEVLVSPEWIDDVSWLNSEVTVALDRATIKGAPAFTEGQRPDRDAERAIYAHYGREGYWHNEQAVDLA